MLESVHVSPIHKARCRIESYMTTKISNEIIAAAIEGFQARTQRLDAQIAELRQLLTGGSGVPAATPEPVGERRKLTAAARERMAEAQKSGRGGPRPRKEPTAAAKTAKLRRQEAEAEAKRGGPAENHRRHEKALGGGPGRGGQSEIA